MENKIPTISRDQTLSDITRRKSRKDPSECRICGASALYCYYGAIVCDSCKIFFKRNGLKKQRHFTCLNNGHCEINILNRRMCSSCRLAKCISNGMQIELFRPSAAKSHRTNRKFKSATSTIDITSKRTESNVPIQLPTLNLLRADRSTLTYEQWTLLSNIIHCHDEYSRFSIGEQFLQQQNKLPIKIRFKIETTKEFFKSCASGAQLLFENIQDFVSLSSQDRSLLLRNTMKHIGGLTACIIFQTSKLFDNPAFCNTGETVYGVDTFNSKYSAIYYDSNEIFMKLILTILIFSTPEYVRYTDTPCHNLQDAKTIYHIQEKYIELAWKYLLYKYDHDQAVRCFSNFIRCYLLLNKAVVAAVDLQHYKDLIDSLVKQTEQSLVFTN
ncbi:hypothetical protein I4U23_013246 [Adineta vaga]|nr:hypothetical protein I4U23_013246 [Adineta vaga]